MKANKLGVKLTIAIWTIFSLLACLYPTLARAGTQFTYEDLGDLQSGIPVSSWAINASGQVVGWTSIIVDGTPYDQAFLKTPGQPMENLGTLPGELNSIARGINASGQIVGHGVISGGWFKNPGEPMQPIFDPGEGGGQPLGINDSGQIVGAASFPGQYWTSAFLKNPGQPIEDLGILPVPGLTRSQATAINAGGQVVGECTDNGNSNAHGFLKNPGEPMEDLGTGTGFWDSLRITAINASGQIVGCLDRNQYQDSCSHAILKNPGQPIQDLGVLPGFDSSTANGINAGGQIAGGLWNTDSHSGSAFIKNPGQPMQDLNNLVVDLPAGLRLKNATAINDKGQITGSVKLLNGNERAFLLTPVQPPVKPMSWLPLLMD